MDLRDVFQRIRFSSSYLSTSNHMHDESSILLPSVHKRSGDYKDQLNNVNHKYRQLSTILEKNKDLHRSQQHTREFVYYYNNQPTSQADVTFESVSLAQPWREVAFPIVLFTSALIGVVLIGIVLLLWFKSLTKNDKGFKRKLIDKTKLLKLDKQSLQTNRKMNEYDCSQMDVPITIMSGGSSLKLTNLPISTKGHLLEHAHYKEGSRRKNNSYDNLQKISSPHSMRRAYAKPSLNNFGLPTTLSAPSSPAKATGRNGRVNEFSFFEWQSSGSRSKCSKKEIFTEHERSDELRVQDKSLKCKIISTKESTAVSENSETINSPSVFSSPKVVRTQTSEKEVSVASPVPYPFMMDDKENLPKCALAFEGWNTHKSRADNQIVKKVETACNQTPPNTKILTQSPLFFPNEHNSPVVYDSSSSPTLIPSLTPSSVSSSVTSSATNTTPNVDFCKSSSACSMKGRFTFSPKVISEYSYQDSSQRGLKQTGNDHKYGNSYFRFPEVDTFTPPNSAQVSNQFGISKTNNLKIPSLVTSCVSSLETNIQELASAQNTSMSNLNVVQDHDNFLTTDINDTAATTTTTVESEKYSSTSDNCSENLASQNRVSRRVRLKSISLDSEGARLVEENLTSSIPVEELVELAANQTHYSTSENHLQLQPSTHTFLEEVDKSFNSFKRQRNIFNLTLNLDDKDETLAVDNDYKFNEFYFEYYDYDDEEDEEFIVECDGGTGYNEKPKKQSNQLQTPKTPTLTQTRKKASSLDSDQSLRYILPQTVVTCSSIDRSEQRNNSRCMMMNSSTSTIRTSSLSVPTTPKRQPYRLQQQHGKYKQNRHMNDNIFTIDNSPASERHPLSSFQQKLGSFDEHTHHQNLTDCDSKSINSTCSNTFLLQDANGPNANLNTLPEITPTCDSSEISNEITRIQKPPIQTINKSRSSILQRRGSNHSLTLNLDAIPVCGALSKGLSASNYSLGNYTGSHLSLAGSSYNLQNQQHQNAQKSVVHVLQTKKNLLQRRGSNTSLILNLQESNSSLNRFNSHSSLNIQSQQHTRPIKKGLLERRNSNTSLTLINIQNRALSVSNCNIPGSVCSLNSVATYQTQNEALMLEEDEHQTVCNNKQSNHCNRIASGPVNESHLSPNCQQHGGRRKFLSSDSLHNITSVRAGCCCQQKETTVNNSEHCCNVHRNNYGGSTEDVKQQPMFLNTDCTCKINKNNQGIGKLSITSKDMFRFKPTVTSTASTNNLTQFTCCDCCCCNCAELLAGGVNAMSISNTNVRQITTKPLSPQTTSEDFKIYLANIQFLQNASNLLSEAYLKKLQLIFKRSYGSYTKTSDDNVLPGANNDVKLTSISIVTTVSDVIADSTQSTNNENSSDNDELLSDDEQKKMILKIHQEFWNLPTNYQEKPLVFGSQSKNRYKTILPNEHSRVILKAEPGIPTEPYINANFIKGPDYTNNSYIATQGPMANTIYEFWQMVKQNIVRTASNSNYSHHHIEQKLVMLTNFLENNRQKCSVYFPQNVDESVVFGSSIDADTSVVLQNSKSIITDTQNHAYAVLSKPANPAIDFNYFLITNIGICRKNGYTMRKLFVIYAYQQKTEMLEIRSAYTVYHYWFPDWPDHRSPEDIDVLLDMSIDILDNDCCNDFENTAGVTERLCSLPIIHCSAGIGRTGCLLAILNGLSQMRSSLKSRKEVTGTNGEGSENVEMGMEEKTGIYQPTTHHTDTKICVDILGIVCNLRLQRGGMVQNSEQYELIHRALCLYMQHLGI
ncbi:uncharacterized protein LOC129765478 [Toxorhynchites rutilus septentrionalis]|uniref:uncharacterized protein LOC129765478 n=1 Tax=Toxorhynchites rutilus septentrionalis TaxID=329112 RepID=UPI00247AA062|nr:uncharacterized protein LOC129765478 [Toxorhynchites rutilus septentrionalis]XP_055621815.1 uncharacterized protein LOC129765478 [Toxorhynchites rutilus septentrionalis]XP_055621817.1 uncharacterized protein LOC129765478 [Toxorhynchites rutilus septentrionalis]